MRQTGPLLRDSSPCCCSVAGIILASVLLLISPLAAIDEVRPATGLPPVHASETDRLWEDEIVYVLIPQKFFNGDPANDVMARRYRLDRDQFEGGFWGGDLAGASQKLDDLVDLGITTIMLYPVIQNDQRVISRFLPTGYRPKDYFQVDENFGDLKTLQQFIRDAHDKGLRVLLDLPLGMPGFEHPYLSDPAKKDWFGEQTEWGPPRWNVARQEVADYLIQVGRYWQRETGCDGFRLDSVQLHPDEFWQRFNAEMHAGVSHEFILFAEMVKPPREIGLAVKEIGFDTAYDFSAGIAREILTGRQPLSMYSFVFREAKQYYSSPRSLAVQIDNYENPTFLSQAPDFEQQRLLAAMTYLLTIDRVPLLFTGNELGIDYTQVGAAFPEDRRSSPFYQSIKRLIDIRRSESALRRGACSEVKTEEPVYAYLRTLRDQQILVVINHSQEPQSVQFPVSGRPWKTLHVDDLLAQSIVKRRGQEHSVELPPYGAAVLKLR